MDTRETLETTGGWQEAIRLCTRQARSVLGRGAAVDDVVQEALLRAWTHRAQCRDPGDPWSWVASIARREALREVARPATFALPHDPEEAGPPTERDVRLALQEALERLLPLDRAVVLERHVLDRTSEEIGEAHGLTPGAVRVRLHRSRARLRGLLTES